MDVEQAAALRAPFPDSAVGKLPKAGTVLSYIGHAAVTDRLLQVDPGWAWEPVAWDEHGLPYVEYGAHEAVLWIRLTVCDVTRYGVGTAPVKAPELHKQLISDAIRNASMRFGVALDLWAKEPLGEPEIRFDPAHDADPAVIEQLKARLGDVPDTVRLEFTRWKDAQQFPWPWPVDVCTRMGSKLDELLADVVPAGGEPEPPASSFSAVEDPAPPSAPPAEPAGTTTRRKKPPVEVVDDQDEIF